MAGPAGFEPANAGTKTQCLTTWRRSKMVELYHVSLKNKDMKIFKEINDFFMHTDKDGVAVVPNIGFCGGRPFPIEESASWMIKGGLNFTESELEKISKIKVYGIQPEAMKEE